MARRQHDYNSGRIYRAGDSNSAPTREQAPARSKAAPKKKRKKKGGGGKRFAIVMTVILLVGAVSVFGLYNYVGGLFGDTGDFGIIDSAHYTPQEYQGDVINILIVGIDYEEGRDHALTDMILYANFDIKNNKLNLLQFPRDIFVGYDNASGGKINAAMTTGSDKDNPINNLVRIVTEQYQLPVDNYITIDMDGFKSIIGTFNSIRVYVPQEMSYAGSYLPAGWQWLDAEAAEFFVRNRMGTGFERADIDRLDNQRYFYSALFRRFLNLTITDCMKLLPVFEHYCNTDITANGKMDTLFDLAASGLKLTAEDVTFCKVPGATDMPGYGNNYVVDIYGRASEEDAPGVAALLNEYFRTYGEPVSAETLIANGLPNVAIPDYIALYPPNVQRMGEIQEDEGGAEVDVEPTHE